MVSKMENGHGKVWICLLILVLAAVVIGLLYYTTAAKEPDAISTNVEWGDRIWHLNL